MSSSSVRGPDFGVYIHYPWCRHRCPYCDFAIAVAKPGEAPSRRYTDTVIAELDQRAADYAGHHLVSIYLGGGTPSLWPEVELGEVLDAVRQRFGAASETTLEANPVDCTPERMARWRAMGIDRLSIGVQSVEAGDLVVLGRDHRMGQGPAAIEAALAAGFERLSADLMLSVPGASADPGLSRVAEMGVPHLSVYELTVEPRTPLARAVERGEVVPFSDDETAERYLRAHDELTRAGYEHYEVSSYARPGHRSRHNSLYWQGAAYLGLGNGAASLRLLPDGSGERRTNLRSVGAYLDRPPGQAAEGVELIDAPEMARDRVWLGLRSLDGAVEHELAAAPALVEFLVGNGLAERLDGRIVPTIRGFLHHEAIARRVVGALG